MHTRTSCVAVVLLAVAMSASGRADEATDAARAARPHHVYLVGNLLVSRPYLDLAAGAADGVGAYLTVENRSATPDKLIGGGLDGGGTLVMFPQEGGGLPIPAGGQLMVRPGMPHLRLADRAGLSADGSPLDGTLRFERAGVVHVTFARSPAQAADEDQSAPAIEDKPVNLAQ